MVFDNLREKLQSIQGRLSQSISQKNDDTESSPAPDQVPAAGDKKEAAFFEKVKVLITEGELVIGDQELEKPIQELEMALLESDVAFSVTEEICSSVRAGLVGKKRKIGTDVNTIVLKTLTDALRSALGEGFDLLAYTRNHPRPVKILFIGVNGTGKTTTIAKIGQYLKKNGFSVVIGAGDTFRAGAIEQIDVHAERIGIKVIQHQAGADPSAVLFDTIQYATSHSIDVILADTAGRFHNRVNLMNQLSKIRRVMNPDLIVYVDEAVAGNDAVVRAEEFAKTIGIDAVVLTKVDMDPRGGAALSVAHAVGRPLLFIGTGQGYDDIRPFNPEEIVGELLGVGLVA
jgi:fused signal recognition particle receptor